MRFTRDQLFGLKMGALASIESGNGKQGDQNTVDLCSDLLLLHDAASEYFRIGAREPFDHGDHADFVRARQNLQDALKHTPIHAPAHPEAPLCEICKGRGKVGGYWDSGPDEIVGGTTCHACNGTGKRPAKCADTGNSGKQPGEGQ